MIKKRRYKLTDKQLLEYETYLREQERAENTIQKYIRDLKNLQAYTEGKVFTKELLLAWKEELLETRSSVSVNSMLAAANSFFTFMGWQELTMRFLKVQKTLFRDESKELTRTEYASLVREARREGNERLSLLMQTICATGIRVSELQYITVEAVARGRAEINNKGKRRVIFLPQKLQKLLRKYLQKQKITAGAVFVTKSGNPLDRTNIWREMKLLCERAGGGTGKSFPTQFAPPVCQNVLRNGEGSGAFSRYFGTFQREHNADLYGGKLPGLRKTPGTIGSDHRIKRKQSGLAKINLLLQHNLYCVVKLHI